MISCACYGKVAKTNLVLSNSFYFFQYVGLDLIGLFGCYVRHTLTETSIESSFDHAAKFIVSSENPSDQITP